MKKLMPIVIIAVMFHLFIPSLFYDKDGNNRFNVGLAAAGNAGMSFNDENFEKLIDLDTKLGYGNIYVKK